MIYHKVNNWPPAFYRVADEPEQGWKVIDFAATILGRSDGPKGVAFVHVATWEAGSGQREDKLTPAEFESWRRSFEKPSNES